MVNKTNDTPKNNKPKEQMELKRMLQKATIDSIKNANVPSINEPSIQLFGTLGCQTTISLNVGIYIWTSLMYVTYTRLAV